MGGSLPLETLLKIIRKHDKYKNISCFVETGTYQGGTIIPMSRYFKKLYTIEIKAHFSHNVRQIAQMKNISNINFIIGDSGEKLESIVKQISEPTIFFLDGHWCGLDTGYGGKDCPLLEEIQHIENNHNDNSIIIIDDARLFGIKRQKPHHKDLSHQMIFGQEGKVEDWTNITVDNAINCLQQEKVKEYYIEDDRLIIFLNKISD